MNKRHLTNVLYLIFFVGAAFISMIPSMLIGTALCKKQGLPTTMDNIQAVVKKQPLLIGLNIALFIGLVVGAFYWASSE